MFEIQTYLSEEGDEPYAMWLASLSDRHTKARVVVRVSRMASGNLGDVKSVGKGVWEARIHHGPGYRLYYAQAAQRLILLLMGGNKATQPADIVLAQHYWTDWQRRSKPT